MTAGPLPVEPSEGDPAVIAHRGFAGQFPENTVAAVRGAVDAGAAAVEVDVMPTADGDVVVFHDERLDAGSDSRGLTDSAGVVWEQPTETVTDAAVLGTDERVPLLRDLLAALPPSVGVNVELKNPGTAAVRPGKALADDELATAVERWRPFVDAVLSVAGDAANPCLYSSFCEGALAALGNVAPSAPLAVLVGPDDIDAGRTLARRYDVDAVHLPVSRPADELLSTAATLGAAVSVWTVRDWRDARRAVDAAVDGVIADYAGLDRYAGRL